VKRPLVAAEAEAATEAVLAEAAFMAASVAADSAEADFAGVDLADMALGSITADTILTRTTTTTTTTAAATWSVAAWWRLTAGEFVQSKSADDHGKTRRFSRRAFDTLQIAATTPSGRAHRPNSETFVRIWQYFLAVPPHFFENKKVQGFGNIDSRMPVLSLEAAWPRSR
jgi:hypothetical protein